MREQEKFLGSGGGDHRALWGFTSAGPTGNTRPSEGSGSAQLSLLSLSTHARWTPALEPTWPVPCWSSASSASSSLLSSHGESSAPPCWASLPSSPPVLPVHPGRSLCLPGSEFSPKSGRRLCLDQSSPPRAAEGWGGGDPGTDIRHPGYQEASWPTSWVALGRLLKLFEFQMLPL